MKLKRLILSIAIISVTVMLLSIFGFANQWDVDEDGCIDIMAGKKATVDGSVLTSQTCDGGYDSRLIIIPAAIVSP